MGVTEGCGVWVSIGEVVGSGVMVGVGAAVGGGTWVGVDTAAGCGVVVALGSGAGCGVLVGVGPAVGCGVSAGATVLAGVGISLTPKLSWSGVDLAPNPSRPGSLSGVGKDDPTSTLSGGREGLGVGVSVRQPNNPINSNPTRAVPKRRDDKQNLLSRLPLPAI